MNILRFFRRTKSRYADDKAVDDFARVVEQTKQPYSQADLDAVSDNPEWTAEDIAKARPFSDVFPHMTGQQRIDQAARIIAKDDPSVEDIERLGEMLSGPPTHGYPGER